MPIAKWPSILHRKNSIISSMAAEPLAISPTPPPILPLKGSCRYQLQAPLILSESSSPSSESDDDDDHQDDGNSNTTPYVSLTFPPPRKVHRCKTAPAMAPMRDAASSTAQPQNLESTSTLTHAAILLLLYLSLGVLFYYFNRDSFSGLETHPVVDAFYFCIVTMCTIGYGDIAPLTAPTKIFSCVFVLVGFGFIDVLLSGVVNYVLDLQESVILAGLGHPGPGGRGGFLARDYIVDVAKGRMRIRLKVGLALAAVVLCIGTGTLVLNWVEQMDWVDSIYLSVMSVTTVGYGDRAFKTLPGRVFASIWLLFSTLAVARAFLYLVEARIDKRHRRIANWVLHREITVEDLLAADINNDGFISKSEYIIHKLKEMRKIGEKDIIEICNQFRKLDQSNAGKITLPYLLENHL